MRKRAPAPYVQPAQTTYQRPFEGVVTEHADGPDWFRVAGNKQWFKMPKGSSTPRPAVGAFVVVRVDSSGLVFGLRVRGRLRERIIRANEGQAGL